jgi:hypothetical protein
VGLLGFEAFVGFTFEACGLELYPLKLVKFVGIVLIIENLWKFVPCL